MLVPFVPLWFLLAGTGLARLLPLMTGDLPIPALRYAVATLAVLSLIAMRARVEWPSWSRHATVPPPLAGARPSAAALPLQALSEPVSTPPAIAPPVAAMPVLISPPKPKPHKPVIAHRPNTVLKAAQAKPAKPKIAKPPVRLYVVKNGRLVHRSRWAVQWDMTHPHP